MERTKLTEGVYLQYLNTDKFSTETLYITFTKPIANIDASSMALLPYVLLQGSKEYPSSLVIQKHLKSLYGATIHPYIRKKGEFLSITFACKFISAKYTDDLDILNQVYQLVEEVIFSPKLVDGVFDDKIVEGEKNNLIDLIEAQKNDKRIYANIRMFEIMCKNEPYSFSKFGDITSAQKINNTNLYQAYNDILGSAQVDIFYIGQDNIQALDFSKFATRNAMHYETKIKFDTPNVNEVIEVMDITQGKLSMGFRTNTIATDKDYPALVLMNTILGGSTNSKLFTNIREKMSLCYYASSNIEKNKGVMSINAGIEIKDFKLAKDAILNEFYDIQKGNFTQEDIQSAKLTMINNLSLAKDAQSSTEEYYFTNTLAKNQKGIEDLIKDIDKVSKGEIVDISNKVMLDTIYFLKGEM